MGRDHEGWLVSTLLLKNISLLRLCCHIKGGKNLIRCIYTCCLIHLISQFFFPSQYDSASHFWGKMSCLSSRWTLTYNWVLAINREFTTWHVKQLLFFVVFSLLSVSRIHTNRLPAVALNGTDMHPDKANVTVNDARSVGATTPSSAESQCGAVLWWIFMYSIKRELCWFSPNTPPSLPAEWWKC